MIGSSALLGDGAVRDLPGGLEQYLDLVHQTGVRQSGGEGFARGAVADRNAGGGSASKTARLDERAQRKELARLERLIARLDAKEAELHRTMSDHAADHVRVSELNEQLREVKAEKAVAEEAWLALAVDAE